MWKFEPNKPLPRRAILVTVFCHSKSNSDKVSDPLSPARPRLLRVPQTHKQHWGASFQNMNLGGISTEALTLPLGPRRLAVLWVVDFPSLKPFAVIPLLLLSDLCLADCCPSRNFNLKPPLTTSCNISAASHVVFTEMTRFKISTS